MLELRKQAKYDLIAPTSMGIRITPINRQPVQAAYDYRMQVTSAESNVLSISASLGLKAKLLTTFVKDSPIAKLIQGDLAFRHIDYEGPEVLQGDAWGYRHQFNIADSGFGLRGPRVHNDRAGEVGRTLNVKDFDLDRIFKEEGAKILHLSGLIAAISPETCDFCLQLARKAKAEGTRISFDLNYRASFWKGREDELKKAFLELASSADILIGNEEDFQLALSVPGPEAGGHELKDKVDAFKEMIDNARRMFPSASVFATTLRQVLSANEHLWGAILFADEKWRLAAPREIQIMDRIGGGDAFVGGMLYGILKGWDSEKWMQFGWATGAYVVSLETDYGLPMDEDHIWSIWQGNARIKR